MGLRSVMVSDISGVEGDEGEFVTMTIRTHPLLNEPKAFDVLPSELTDLDSADDLVVVEVGGNGDKQQIVVTLEDFRKVCPDAKLKNGRNVRGRRPGFRPS